MLCILNVGAVPMLWILNVGTVPMLCILNEGTVPTSSSSLKKMVQQRSNCSKLATNLQPHASVVQLVIFYSRILFFYKNRDVCKKQTLISQDLTELWPFRKNSFSKHRFNFFQTPLKPTKLHLNTLQSSLKHPRKYLGTPLKLP